MDKVLGFASMLVGFLVLAMLVVSNLMVDGLADAWYWFNFPVVTLLLVAVYVLAKVQMVTPSDSNRTCYYFSFVVAMLFLHSWLPLVFDVEPFATSQMQEIVWMALNVSIPLVLFNSARNMLMDK